MMLHHAVRVRTALMAFARTSDCRANCLAIFLLGQHCCRTVCLTKRSALSGKLFGVFDTHTAPVTHHLGLLDTPVPSGGGAEGHTEREVRAPPFPNLFTCCHLPPLTSSQKCKPSRPGRRAAEAAAIHAALPEHPPSHTAEGRLSVRRATRIQRRMSALPCLGLGMVSCLPLYSLRARERECPWGCHHGDFGSPCVGAGRGQRLVDGGLSCGEQPRVPWHHTPW